MDNRTNDRNDQNSNDSQADSAGGRNDMQARDGAGSGQSAPERRGSEGAAREFGQQMRDLDRAGTVEEAQERESDESGADEQSGTNGGRNKMRNHALTLGLAASSLALLAGTRGGAGTSSAGGGEKPVDVAASDAFMPPEMVSAEKGVSWDLHVSEHDRVDFFVEFLMGRNYDNTRKWLERIGKYGPMIQNELRERDMPEDLLFLAMIESGLNPTAYSKAHASGMWQFIKETGQRYGLEVTTYVDERNDPVKSTAAGLTYLQMMYDRFDSWYLASAGYNTGENRVGRLMRETTGSEKGTDEGYWDIWDRLPRETRDYVPLMIAMGHIAKEPGKYGFHNLEYQDALAYEEVVVPGGTKLSDVASAAGVSAEVVEDLNPHFIKKQTPPNRRMAVRVPVGQQQQVASALNGQPAVAGAELAE
jgi:membrane-bound lytic murein transglycosylase D